MIDWKKLKAAIKKDTESIRMSKEDGFHGGALNSQKLEATLHHAIAAHERRHIHLSGKFLCNPRWLDSTAYGMPCFEKMGMSLEEQERFIRAERARFELPAPAAEAAA
jgi:hypothetical protein